MRWLNIRLTCRSQLTLSARFIVAGSLFFNAGIGLAQSNDLVMPSLLIGKWATGCKTAEEEASGLTIFQNGRIEQNDGGGTCWVKSLSVTQPIPPGVIRHWEVTMKCSRGQEAVLSAQTMWLSRDGANAREGHVRLYRQSGNCWWWGPSDNCRHYLTLERCDRRP
jgi:hypothetical protein